MNSLSLRHHLLVALPSWHHHQLDQLVVYIYQHNRQGAAGMVLNRPVDVDPEDISPELGHDTQMELLWGGPIQSEQCFVLYPVTHSATDVDHAVSLSTSSDLIHSVAQGQGPNSYRAILGFSYWQPEQLEQELRQNLWLSCPANDTLLFQTPPAAMWRQALRQLSIEPNQLVTYHGHA